MLKMKQIRRAALGSTSAATLLMTLPAITLASLPALADEAQTQTASAPSDNDSNKVEEIIVTGDKYNKFGTNVVQAGSFRGAKALDVPLTVSVIPDAVLKSQQAIDMIDALRNTAGVSSTGVGPVAYNNVTVRGISVNTVSNFKLDGALNILSSTAFPLENKDRVEVLKGASALYYGFSSPAGIVNLTMKRPTEQFYLASNSFADDNGGYGEHVDVGDTIADGKFGYRINGVLAHLDTGIDYSSGRRYLGSGAFDFRPIDDLTITADVERFERRIGEPAIFKLTVPASATAVQLPSLDALDPTKNIAAAPWALNDTRETNYLIKAVYKFSPHWDVSGYYGNSSLIRIRNNPQFTPTNLTTALTTGTGTLSFSAQNTKFKNTNYAVELAGKVDFGEIGGLPVSDQVLLGGSRALRSLASPAPTRKNFTQNFLTPVFIPDPALVFAARPPASHVDDIGGYFFNNINIDDYVHLLGGIRKTDYTDDGSINAVTKSPYHVAPWSFSGGVVVKPITWISVYGTYIEGQEATASAPIADENALETFPPTKSTQYEAGIKVEPMKDLLIQAAYFDIKRGASFEAINPATGNLRFYTIGRQNYRGVEFSLTGYVLPDLALYATATALSAHYANTPNISGLRVEGTPKATWSLAGEYTLSWVDPGLKVTAGVYHTGAQAINAANQAFTPGYTTFDAGASYAFQLDQHDIIMRVNGQNITNKRYWASTGTSTLAENVPGVVKFSLTVKY